MVCCPSLLFFRPPFECGCRRLLRVFRRPFGLPCRCLLCSGGFVFCPSFFIVIKQPVFGQQRVDAAGSVSRTACVFRLPCGRFFRRPVCVFRLPWCFAVFGQVFGGSHKACLRCGRCLSFVANSVFCFRVLTLARRGRNIGGNNDFGCLRRGLCLSFLRCGVGTVLPLGGALVAADVQTACELGGVVAVGVQGFQFESEHGKTLAARFAVAARKGNIDGGNSAAFVGGIG